MDICTTKPDTLLSLKELGIERDPKLRAEAPPSKRRNRNCKPLHVTKNRWIPISVYHIQADIDEASPQYIERKVKALLNKLSLPKFDSISDQIVAWLNEGTKEKRGSVLAMVIKLIFQHATNLAAFSGMYVRLCCKISETMSKHVVGVQLFVGRLFKRCEEDLEQHCQWSTKETGSLASALVNPPRPSITQVPEKKADGYKHTRNPDEVEGARRKSLALIKFVGELFKALLLPARFIQEYIQTSFAKLDIPQDEEILKLCVLFFPVGKMLDMPRSKGDMDVYIERMKILSNNATLSWRVRFMLLVSLLEPVPQQF